MQRDRGRAERDAAERGHAPAQNIRIRPQLRRHLPLLRQVRGHTCRYQHSVHVARGREPGLELREDVDTVLAPGMILSMEPMLMVPEVKLSRISTTRYLHIYVSTAGSARGRGLPGARLPGDPPRRQRGERHQVPLRARAQRGRVSEAVTRL